MLLKIKKILIKNTCSNAVEWVIKIKLKMFLNNQKMQNNCSKKKKFLEVQHSEKNLLTINGYLISDHNILMA